MFKCTFFICIQRKQKSHSTETAILFYICFCTRVLTWIETGSWSLFSSKWINSVSVTHSRWQTKIKYIIIYIKKTCDFITVWVWVWVGGAFFFFFLAPYNIDVILLWRNVFFNLVLIAHLGPQLESALRDVDETLQLLNAQVIIH